MAARDRYGYGGPGASATPLQRHIQRACAPENFEADLAMELDIAELINQKKGSAPREAAVAIVGFINHRNPNISLLALHLLDICVKNCGYPFHLQISTKEFLNELVRRFPERPPVRPSRVQTKILEAIEEWRQTICTNSKHKDDLGFIRDMHRLLLYKGYMFPEVRREDASVLNPSDNLKSAEEMEEEEKAAQSAKLQELIRRGGPEDLQEANKLMKVMAGYDTRNKTDYRAKAAEEVHRVQEKAKILEEMLQGFKEGDKLAEGDVFEELASALQSAQPKIQKMCEEESSDQEAVAKLLEINDSIHRTIERYKLVKKGDVEGASKIPKGTLGTSTGVGKTATQELSLIDFGGEDELVSNGQSSSTPQAEPSGSQSIENDLLGLSMNDAPFGQMGGIALGPTSVANISGFPNFPAARGPNAVGGAAPSPLGVAASSGPAVSSKPDYSAFSSLTGSRPSPGSFPAPAHGQGMGQQKPAADPFSALGTGSIRQRSPFQASQSNIQGPTTQVPGAWGTTSTAAAGAFGGPSASSQVSDGQANDGEEWTFSSALPEASGAPNRNDLLVSNSIVQIRLAVTRQEGAGLGSMIELLARFSNNTPQPVSDLTFQVAFPKGYSLQMEPQSGRTLPAQAQEGVRQKMRLNGVEVGKGSTVKMRWKASYRVGTETREEQGEIAGLGIA
ncbi:MAG: hypothetical protein M1814_004045 [Vezdaea aestivalis]|nr:MAG: hypothetical protein M1814_004045 [Vezdaea aestivalis]